MFFRDDKKQLVCGKYLQEEVTRCTATFLLQHYCGNLVEATLLRKTSFCLRIPFLKFMMQFTVDWSDTRMRTLPETNQLIIPSQRVEWWVYNQSYSALENETVSS